MTPAPRRALAEGCLILAIVAGPFAFAAVEPWSEALLVLLCAAALFACGDSAFRARGGWAVPGLFVAAAFLALVQAMLPASAWGPAPLGPHTIAPVSSLTAAAKFLACAALALACRAHFDDEAGRRRLAWVLLGSGAAIALIGLLQLADGNERLYGLRWYQSRISPFGPFYNRNHAAAWLSMGLLAGAGLVFDRLNARREASRPRADFAAELAIMACLLALLGAGLIAARSRGALAALAAGGFLFALFRRRLTVTIAVAALALAALGVWVGRSKGGLAASFAQRRAIYASTRTSIADFPVFGRGLGAYESLMPAYQARTDEGFVRQAHSDPLHWTAEAGAPLFGGALLVAAAVLIVGLRRELDPLRAGYAAAAAAFLLHGLVDFGGQIFGLLVPFSAIWSLVPSPRPQAAMPEALRAPATALTCVFLCLAVAGMAVRAAALPPLLGPALVPLWTPPGWCAALADPAGAAASAAQAALASGDRSAQYEALAALERRLAEQPFKHRLHLLTGRLLDALGRGGDAAARDEAARRLRHG